ncbi:hypothetical protein N2152v2_010463 [Parachlorella kessleri]
MAAVADDQFGAPLKQIIYENTYRLPEEYGHDAKFNTYPIQQIMKTMLAERLKGLSYDPVKASQLVKQLADDIREKVKGLGYERYKLVVQCELGEKKGQAVNIVSRCLWDTNTDGFASETFETETLFCNCQVYALYFE